MKNRQLLENIIDWQIQHKYLKRKSLGKSIKPEFINVIEGLLNEKFPGDLLELYKYGNGQELGSKDRIFLGLRFMNSNEIISQLKFSKGLIKTDFQPDEKSEILIKQIVDFYKNHAPKHSFFGFKKSWDRIEAQCGIGHYGGPYFYKQKTTTNKERKPIKINDYSGIKETIHQLHEMEKNSWDELNFTIYSNGEYEVDRSSMKFNDPKSNPEGAVKEIYFHNKWIPFMSDEGGNYIGYDLDPGETGEKGQIIIYGRDENENTVVGKSLTIFLTKIFDDLTFNEGKYLINQNHLLDNIKRMK